MHSHPLHAFQKINKGNAEKIIQQYTTWMKRTGIMLPPSEANMDIKTSIEGVSAKRLGASFEKNDLDYNKIKKGVVEPAGVWLYNRIDSQKLDVSSPLRKYLESKTVLKKELADLWEKS